MSRSPRSVRFRKDREAIWKDLEGLVGRADRKGVGKLSVRELRDLAEKYRATLSSLSVARAISLDRAVVHYLENLCARAYLHVHASPSGFWAGVIGYFTRVLPRTFRAFGKPILASALVLIAGTVVGWWTVLDDPFRFYEYVDPGLAGGRGPTASRESLEEVLFQTEKLEELSFFSGFLFQHNSRIAIWCAVLGVVPFVPTLYLLFMNGTLLGAFIAIHHRHDLLVELFSWLLPHGVTELFAIVVAGGVGLAISRSIASPGQFTRIRSLVRCGRRVAPLIFSTVLMLFVAALIEGYFRQLVQSIPIRYSVVVGTSLFWILYLGLAGRRVAKAELDPVIPDRESAGDGVAERAWTHVAGRTR